MTSNHKDPSTMTTHKDTLLELADRCENATGPDRELDAIICAALDGYTGVEERSGWIVAVGKPFTERSLGRIDPGEHSRNFTPQHHDTPTFTASLDAAITLVPEGWVECYLRRFDDTALADCYQSGGGKTTGEAATPPLALCAASLRARAAQ
jgi:hypothetical protein